MTGWRRCTLALLLLIGIAHPVAADEFRPAYLQLSQLDATTYDVLWKIPALNENTSLRLKPVFPTGTVELTPPRGSFANAAMVLHWRVREEGGLNGKAVVFPDLPTTRIDILVRLVRIDGTVQLARVLPFDPRFTGGSDPKPHRPPAH